MYARYFTFQSVSANRGAIEEVASEVYYYTKTLPGFMSAAYVVSDDETKYGSFTIWMSRKEAEEAGSLIREVAMPKLEGLLTMPPEVEIMEIYEPG